VGVCLFVGVWVCVLVIVYVLQVAEGNA